MAIRRFVMKLLRRRRDRNRRRRDDSIYPMF